MVVWFAHVRVGHRQLSIPENPPTSYLGGGFSFLKKQQYYAFLIFWSATLFISTEVFEPWAKQIEADSNGRLKVELYPSADLAKADFTYESAAKGTIDIGLQAHGYTNVRFPLTQITELPSLSNSATQMGCTL